MEVQLTDAESAAVRKALESYNSDLRMEITDTDNPGYRRTLREERALLDAVVRKLSDAVAAADERDGDGRVVVRVVSVWTETG